MSKFRKIFFALALLFAGIFVLTACDKVDLEKAKTALEIKYVAGEVATTVKSDLTLPTSLEEFKGVTISWESDKPAVISNAGKVTRQDADTVVTLTATLKLEGKDPVKKTFKVTVKAKEVVIPKVTFKVSVPQGTEEVFLIGSMVGADWPIAEAVALTKGTDGNFSVTLDLAAGDYEYKYVCAKEWAYVEKKADDSEMANRAITVSATMTQEDVVAKWAKVPGQAEPTELKSLLDEHYAESIAIHNFLVETETLNLVKTIGDHTITWTSSNEAVINAKTGKVTRPAYTDGAEIFVILQASAEGQTRVTYIVKVQQLPQTLEQKLDAELTRLTNFPSSTKPILKVNLDLAALKDVKVDGEVVTQATWTSSSPDHLTHDGKLTDLEFEGDVDVTMTVTFTHGGITKTKGVVFTVRGVMVYVGFEAMINGEDKAAEGDMVKINAGVSLYTETNDGYYLVDSLGALLFVYGKTGKPAANKLFAVKMEYDLHYASPQGKNPVYTEIEGAANTVAAAEEITIEALAEKAVPSDANPLVHKLYKVTGAKLHTYNKDDNYSTFLVPQTHNDATKIPTKADSLMLYYQTPGGLAKLQAFAPLNQTYSIDLDHIVIVVSAFRTNDDIFAFMFLGNVNSEADLKFGLATPEQAANQALMAAAGKIQNQIFVDSGKYNLPATAKYLEAEFNITYVSETPTLVDNTGNIVSFPTPGTIENVTFKLSTQTKEDTPQTVELIHTVKLGRPATIKIDEALTKTKGTVVAVEGYLFNDSNKTYVFANPDSTLGLALRYFGSDLVAGKWYLVIAERADAYKGLEQFNFVGAVELSKTDAFVPVAYTGELTTDALKFVQNQVISLENMEVSVKPAKNASGVLTFKLKNITGQEIAFREHQSKTALIDAIMALNLEVGDFVNVTSTVVSWFDNPQFILVSLERGALTPQQIFNQKVELLQGTLPADNTVMYSNFTLPVTYDTLAIAWTVTEGDAATVDADGKVTITRKATEATVKLSGAVTEGEFSATVVVTVKIAAEGAVQPVELITTIDFGSKAVIGYEAGNLVFTNGDGTVYTLNKDRAQANTSTYAPHDTQGVFLVLSCKKTAQFAFTEFDFSSLDITKLQLSFSVWNQNNFAKITGYEGASVQLEKFVDGSWVAVAETGGNTNLLGLFTKDAYTEITFDNLTSGLYRLTYSVPDNTSSSNTEYAVTVDDIKIYGYN